MTAAHNTDPTAPGAVLHPPWCPLSFCEDDGVDVVHREIPDVVVPHGDSDHMISVALIQADEHSDRGLEVYPPEMALETRAEDIVYLSMREATELRDVIDAAITRGLAGMHGKDGRV